MMENYQLNKSLTNSQNMFRDLPEPKGKPNLDYLIELSLLRNINNNVKLEFQSFKSLDSMKVKVCNKIYSLFDIEQRNKFLLLHKLISESYYNEIESNDDMSKRRKLYAIDTLNTMHNIGGVSNPIVISIDSKPGVGKSFTLIAFISTYIRPVNVYIYCHTLISPLKRHPNIISNTIASFKVKCLNGLSYKASFRYANKYITPFDVMVRLLALIDSIQKDKTDSDLLVIDEYTVLEPEMLLLYYFYSLKYNKNLIFSGDSKQLNSIQTSQFHSQSNLKILQILSTESIELEVVKRSKDPLFNKLIDKLRSLTGGSNTSLTFNIEHNIFLDHEYKFYATTDYSSTLLATRHVILTKRVRDYRAYLLQNNIIPYESPYFINVKDKKNTMIRSYKVEDNNETAKFCPWLLLVKNDLYEYIRKNKNDYIESLTVCLNEIQYMAIDNNTVAAVKVFATNIYTGEQYEIERQELKESYYITSEYLIWLNESALKSTIHKRRDYPVFQFPLKLTKTSTFHNIQGSTISHNKIEINMEFANVEAIYVGLSRVSDYSLINKMYSKYLHSHMLTKIMNHFDDNMYYYKISEKTLYFYNNLKQKQINLKLIEQLGRALEVLNRKKNIKTIEELNKSILDMDAEIFKSSQYFEVFDSDKFESGMKRDIKIKKAAYQCVMDKLKEKNDNTSSLMILTEFIKHENKNLLEIIKPKNKSFECNPKSFVGQHCYRYIYENYNGVNELKKRFAKFYEKKYPYEYKNSLNFIFSDTMQLYPKFKDTMKPFDFFNNCDIDITGVNKFDIISRKDDSSYCDDECNGDEFVFDEVYDFFTKLK